MQHLGTNNQWRPYFLEGSDWPIFFPVEKIRNIFTRSLICSTTGLVSSGLLKKIYFFKSYKFIKQTNRQNLTAEGFFCDIMRKVKKETSRSTSFKRVTVGVTTVGVTTVGVSLWTRSSSFQEHFIWHRIKWSRSFLVCWSLWSEDMAPDGKILFIHFLLHLYLYKIHFIDMKTDVMSLHVMSCHVDTMATIEVNKSDWVHIDTSYDELMTSSSWPVQTKTPPASLNGEQLSVYLAPQCRHI